MQNFWPCRGFVRTSFHISFVGQYFTDMSLLSILSSMNEKRILICFMHFELDDFPFCSTVKLLWLSWCIIFSFIRYPCSSRKYHVHNIWGKASSKPMSSAWVELSAFNFCFMEKLITAHFPMFMILPVCSLQLLWIVYKSSTYHFTVSRANGSRISLRNIVSF